MRTFKSLFGMMAVALMAASCSNDIADVQVPEQIAKDGTIHFTATLAPKSFDATTRALVEEGDVLKSNWVAGEKIKVTYKTKGGTKVDSGTVKINESGVATIEADFSEAIDGGAVDFFYPAELYGKANPIAEQDGELSSKLDIRKYSSTMKVEGSEATVVGTINMEAQYAIVSFGLGEVAMSNNLYADKLVIFNGDEKLVTVTSTSSGNSTPYVAIPALISDNLRFWAKNSDDVYFARGTANLQAGKYYKTGMKMAKPGNVIGGDGKFYEDATTATNAGTTAEAMVGWIQDDVGTNGPMYAIALEDYKKNDSAKMTLRTAVEDTSLRNWSNSHKIPFGKWDLPSAELLALFIGGMDKVLALNVPESNYIVKANALDFRTMLTNAGGKDLVNNEVYWTSSTWNSSYVWILNIGDNTAASESETSPEVFFSLENNNTDDKSHYVRYILKF